MIKQEKGPRICLDWLRNGGCTRAGCKFAHYKTNICADFKFGRCIYGDECLYIHQVSDQRKAASTSPMCWSICEPIQDNTTKMFDDMEQQIGSTKRRYTTLNHEINVLSAEVEQMERKISSRLSMFSQLEKTGEQIQLERLRLEEEERNFKQKLADFEKDYKELNSLQSRVQSHKNLISSKTAERQKIIDEGHQNVATKDADEKLCAICMDSQITHVLVPCGHAKFCFNCVENVKECPVCRGAVTMCVKLFS